MERVSGWFAHWYPFRFAQIFGELRNSQFTAPKTLAKLNISVVLPTANGLICASNISPLRYFANSHFVLRNLRRIRNAAVRIRQMVRTLNAQFCCVLRTNGANQNIFDNLNHVLASSPRLARV